MIMSLIDELLDEMSWDKSDEDKDNALNKLIAIEDDLIPSLIRYKDERAATVLKLIGYPRVKNILYELLVWLQDINWPGALDIADLIVGIGVPMIPHIKRAFDEKDDIWHYWIITEVLDKWDRESIKPLEDELMKLAKSFDFCLMAEGVDVESMKLLLERGLGNRDRLIQVYKDKKEYNNYIRYNLESIQDLISKSQKSSD